jgi:hypothetical protein
MAGRGTTLIARGTLFQKQASLFRSSRRGQQFTALCGRKKKAEQRAFKCVSTLAGRCSLCSFFFFFIYLAEASGKCKGVRLQVFHEVLLPVLCRTRLQNVAPVDVDRGVSVWTIHLVPEADRVQQLVQHDALVPAVGTQRHVLRLVPCPTHWRPTRAPETVLIVDK